MAVVDDVRTLGAELERSYPVYVHGRDTAVMRDTAAQHPEVVGIVAWSPLVSASLDRGSTPLPTRPSPWC